MPGQCPTPRVARGFQAVAGSDYKAVLVIRYKGSMTKNERRSSNGSHLLFAGMPVLNVSASKAFRLGHLPFPA